MSRSVTPESSLRERKKAQTRNALIVASQALFAERGYNATTLEDIAATAGVTVQTLLRYFDSKALLALAPLIAPLELLKKAVSGDGRRARTLSIWRHHVEAEALEVTRSQEHSTLTHIANLRAFQSWDDKDPTLVAALSDIEMQLQGVLACGLANDAGRGGDDLRSILVAAMLVAGRRAVWNRWLANGGEAAALVRDHMRVIDQAASLPRQSTA